MSFSHVFGPSLVVALFLSTGAARAAAQDTPPHPPPDETASTESTAAEDIWVASISAGLALSSGNSNTSTVNIAFDAVRDDHRRFVYSTSGLWIRGDEDDELNVDRRWLSARFDARFSEHTSGFVEASYLRDRFKGINYMIAPTAGVTLRIHRRPRDFAVDASLGAVVEKNSGLDQEAGTSPAFAAGERLAIELNDAARITQSFRTFLKLNDLGDVLYTFNVGLAASMSEHSELKAELIDTFKNEPPEEALARNDVSVLVSIVYKF